MKLVRFIHKGRESYGYMKEDWVEFLQGDIASGFKAAEDEAPLDEIKLLSPVLPSKAVCVGQNYLDHIKEMGNEIPDEPVIFMKPPTSVIGPGDTIMRPPISDRVDYEGELAVVIGKQAKDLSEENAFDYVLGYTCANDVTARDLQKKDGQWIRAKGFDTFLPLGPCIETEIDPGALGIRTFLNGEIVQDSCTDQLLFKIPRLLSFITAVMTLEPGDVVLTGTGSGVGAMARGDVVTVEIEGIGRLENIVE